MIFFYGLINLLIIALYLGAVSRWHGGGFFKAPKMVKNLAWGFPFGAVTTYAFSIERWTSVNLVWSLSERFGAMNGLFINAMWAFPIVMGVIVWIACALLKGTGHGGGIDRSTSTEEPGAGRTMEKLEYLIYWFGFKRWSRKTYDDAILFLTGLFAVLPAALAIGFVFWPAGVLTIIGGSLKPKAYHIGYHEHEAWRTDLEVGEVDEQTEIGEFLTGVFAGLFLGLAAIVLWLAMHLGVFAND